MATLLRFRAAAVARIALKQERWQAAEHALELDPIRQAWLSRRGLPPLHFLADSDVLAVPGLRSFWVAEREGTPVAYLVALPIPARSPHSAWRPAGRNQALPFRRAPSATLPPQTPQTSLT